MPKSKSTESAAEVREALRAARQRYREWQAKQDAFKSRLLLRPTSNGPLVWRKGRGKVRAGQIALDETKYELKAGGITVKFGDTETWDALVKLCHNRGSGPIRIDDGSPVRDLRKKLRESGLDWLASAIRTQRNLGYHLALRDD
jgi:hypothetical protein